MYNADLEFSTNVTLHHILAGVTERDTVRYRIFWASKIGFLRSILEVQGDRPLVELPGACHTGVCQTHGSVHVVVQLHEQ